MPNARILKREGTKNLSLFRFTPITLDDDLTRPTQLEVEGNEWLFIGELSASKTGAKLLLLLRSRKEGRGGGGGGFVGNKAGGKHPRLQ